MTHVVVSNITPRTSYSPTTGTSYTIPSSWGFFASSDIVVYSGTTQMSYAATPTSSTNFATSGTAVDGGYQGGSVVLGAASTANTITLILDVPVSRETDFPYPSPTLNIEDLNTDLDKSYVLHQQFSRDLARSILLADSDTGSIGTLPQSSDRAGKFAYFDSAGGISAAGLTLSGTTVSVSAFMLTFLDDSTAAEARTTIAASSSLTLGTLATTDQITGSTQIADGIVTYAKIQDVTAASRLLGRGSGASSGDVEELTVGSGLSMSGTTLSASATTPTNDYLVYQDQAASGAAGAGYTAGAWRTVVFDTEVIDTAGIGALSTNQITLAAGSYDYIGHLFCASSNGAGERIRLRNISDTSTVQQGVNSRTNAGAMVYMFTIAGQFTISSSKIFELQVYPGVDLTQPASGTGENEVYSSLLLRRYST